MNLGARLQSINAELNFSGKVCALVTDGAANIVNAAAYLDGSWLNCTAHGLHLAVTDALKVALFDNRDFIACALLRVCSLQGSDAEPDEAEGVPSAVTNAKAVVSHFKRSSAATVALTAQQSRLQLPDHRLIQV